VATHKKNLAKTTTNGKKTLTVKPASKKTHIGRAAHDQEAVITMDRRTHQRDRRGDVEHQAVAPVAEKHVLERRAKVNRRRQIDPTTCERDYTTDEIEFMAAIDEYKRQSGRMFPTCSEVLEVLRNLGYEKRSPVEVPPAHVVPAPMADMSHTPLPVVPSPFSSISNSVTIG
jgi:hypothetical protein